VILSVFYILTYVVNHIQNIIFCICTLVWLSL